MRKMWLKDGGGKSSTSPLGVKRGGREGGGGDGQQSGCGKGVGGAGEERHR